MRAGCGDRTGRDGGPDKVTITVEASRAAHFRQAVLFRLPFARHAAQIGDRAGLSPMAGRRYSRAATGLSSAAPMMRKILVRHFGNKPARNLGRFPDAMGLIL